MRRFRLLKDRTNKHKVFNDRSNRYLLFKYTIYLIIKYNQKNMYNIAINNLIFITNNDKDDLSSLKMLAEVYYKKNDLSLSYLTLAKYYEFKNEKSRVKEYINLAKKNTTNKTILKKIEDFTITLEEKIIND